MHITKKLFTEIGGEFCTDATLLKKKLSVIKAYIFDWDGVFNDGSKNENGSSNFGEPDAMGTNLLRFNHWLLHHHLPITAIMSGERNTVSFHYAKREKLHAVYFKAAHKILAFEHLMDTFHLKPEEIAFVFDDVLDLSLARQCGVRIMINRKSSPLFKNYVRQNGLADNITSTEGGTHGVREACELMIGISGDYNSTIQHRINFSDLYQQYLADRSQNALQFFTTKEGKMEAVDESCL
jgi:3-deoxy-D-manno-octulosonate 8-phosphate phosphatase (KDO 8-P phosphatase)